MYFKKKTSIKFYLIFQFKSVGMKGHLELFFDELRTINSKDDSTAIQNIRKEHFSQNLLKEIT